MNDYIPAEDVEAPISFTGKIGGNLMTIRGNDVDQFVARLDEFIEKGAIQKVADFNELTGAVSTVSSSFSGGSNSNAGGRSQQGGASSGETHPEGLKCGKCQGTVQYKEIKAKSGKTFKLWVCENQRERNDGHHSEFIN